MCDLKKHIAHPFLCSHATVEGGNDGACLELLLHASARPICVRNSPSFIDFQILLRQGPLYLTHGFKNMRLGFKFIIIILEILIEPKCLSLA